LPNLNQFPDIYDVQIFTMICMNYRSVNVGLERKRPESKMCLIVSTKNDNLRTG